MEKRYEWITYEGKKILLANYSDLSEEEYIQTIDQIEKEILREPDNSVLRCTCINSGHVTETIKKKTKEHKEKTKEKVKAVAAVGLTGIKKALVMLIYRDIYLAKSVEDAKEWLVAQ